MAQIAYHLEMTRRPLEKTLCNCNIRAQVQNTNNHCCFFGKSYSEVTQGQCMAVNIPQHPLYTVGVKEY